MKHCKVEVFQICISHLNVAISWPNRIKQDTHMGLLPSVEEQMDIMRQICQRE